MFFFVFGADGLLGTFATSTIFSVPPIAISSISFGAIFAIVLAIFAASSGFVLLTVTSNSVVSSRHVHVTIFLTALPDSFIPSSSATLSITLSLSSKPI